ncbi:3-dehydroquinate synthase [Bergeyella sp. RCAD1439]|uniref:3-dehydroquinate synthase n=1 Tax=Bergeyella anatis TaxID=3113737 RepID=UPI002E1839F2|nr:3-dehydroquinate synthase [Bergeyella sp. RCAD1439]
MILKLDHDFTALNHYIEELSPSLLLFLVDENTHQCCLPLLLGNLETSIPFEIIEITPGEDLKTIETAAQLWSIFADFSADRKALVINLGGGVLTDLGGFVASTYKRGLKFVHIPTTLLAMCDASIGGKTGVDHQGLKNIVGTFCTPEHTFIYPDFLKTLPFRELRSGFAEMLKHGLIADADHWKKLTAEKHLAPEHLAPLIETSMNLKQTIVDQDFKEENLRKTLNFGHTIGHAVESLFLEKNQPVPHGECVALGMIIESFIACIENQMSPSTRDHIVETLCHYYPKLDLSDFSNETLYHLMLNDKKNHSGKLLFSLVTEIGSCNYDYAVDKTVIFEALDQYRKL